MSIEIPPGLGDVKVKKVEASAGGSEWFPITNTGAFHNVIPVDIANGRVRPNCLQQLPRVNTVTF